MSLSLFRHLNQRSMLLFSLLRTVSLQMITQKGIEPLLSVRQWKSLGFRSDPNSLNFCSSVFGPAIVISTPQYVHCYRCCLFSCWFLTSPWNFYISLVNFCSFKMCLLNKVTWLNYRWGPLAPKTILQLCICVRVCHSVCVFSSGERRGRWMEMVSIAKPGHWMYWLVTFLINMLIKERRERERGRGRGSEREAAHTHTILTSPWTDGRRGSSRRGHEAGEDAEWI